MDRAPSTLESLVALELRVLEGPQAGASAPLASGTGCVLATGPDHHADGADIVLRDDASLPTKVRVIAELAQAALEVLLGEVHVDGRKLVAGKPHAWPMYQPLRIGRSVVAFGHSGAEWPAIAIADVAAEALPSSSATAAEFAAAAAKISAAAAAPSSATGKHGKAGGGAQSSAAGEPRKPLRRRAEVWLATTGAVVVLACAGALAMAHLSAPPPVAVTAGAQPLAEALKSSEFATLDVTERNDGRIELRGRLTTLAQRSRLDAWLGAHQFTPTLDVQVDEVLARDVAEVFRLNGVAVQARAIGPGRIAVEASERDIAVLARAEEAARRDVRHLERLAVHNAATPLPPPAPAVPDDPNKRIASVVPGEPAYIVTVDGARYFVGAMLPSGHRITQVAAQRVTLERDGQTSTLNF